MRPSTGESTHLSALPLGTSIASSSDPNANAGTIGRIDDGTHDAHHSRPASAGTVSVATAETMNQNTTNDMDDPTRMVNRKLTPSQLFMITVNGTLGAGLYIRSGQILELAGPLAVFLSFLALGLLAWAVMQCITELLCLWPVPGALPLFVAQFVDKELGYAVAVAYWFTYAVGFSALVVMSASTLSYWLPKADLATHVTVYALLPIVLSMINTLEIGWYGLFEFVTGCIKLLMLATIIVVLVFINCTSEMTSKAREDWIRPDVYDKDAATSFAPAFIMVLPIATFAYTGVEIIAASIIEARWSASPKSRQAGRDGQNGRDAQYSSARGPIKQAIATIQATAVGVPIFIAIAYTITGLLVSLALSRREPALVRLAWIKNSTTTSTDIATATSTGGAITSTPEVTDESSSSPFILIAEYLDTNGMEHPLKHVFNAFILFTALTCANTNLYVSSRTLFGITNNIRAPGGPPKYLAFLGRTDRHKVPQRAVWASAVAFYLAPFIEIWGKFGIDSQLAVAALAQSGAVSVIIVWACQCIAYIRYYRCIGRQDSKAALQLDGLYPAQNVQLVDSQAQTDQKTEEFPYRNHWQPFLASLALLGCLLVLLLFNSAFLWKEFHIVPFLAGYLPIIVFLLLWLGLKVCSDNFKFKWPWFHRYTPAEVVEIFKVLNQLRERSLVDIEAMPARPENNGTNG